jgi:protein-disulfide isomerase
MNRLTTAALAILMLLGASACQQNTEEIQAIKEQNEKILAKLADMDRKLANVQPPARRGPPPEDFEEVHKIDLTGAAVKGKPDAPVTLVEYSDFECPYCARVQEPIKAVLEKYPDKVKLAFKHFPLAFHKNARPLAIASLAAQEQGRFWEFHDVLFEQTAKRSLDAAKVDEYAKQAGCDVEKLKADIEKNRAAYTKRIDADYQQGQNVAVRGTPTLYLNGKKLRDRTVEGISRLIDAALKESSGG